ncbi:NTE family protein RssA [Paraliobacillus sp. PM-2]|uniref:patatin-like phospholipase family protein n=1 Tax=Paraliobacillus sp. PM-2 TaxID=1462524 RepID=UPI00061BF31D|nr:patatin family protein [Paraliobacillus sp. PM-2]CQR47851.1 NTE family protein RssA [Paraliobacillus sp. PM-2]
MNEVGLVLEGGGMRGVYTAGVLDFFHDKKIMFPYVVGASVGACVATSYLANQRGRNYEVLVEYSRHPEYLSLKRLLTRRSLFGMDFIFDTLPNQLVPFDYNMFIKNQSKLVVATTDVSTGLPVYYDSFDNKDELFKLVRASSSLPFVSTSVLHQGLELMDGGVSDPIPIDPSIQDGNRKHVVILTRHKGYKKDNVKFKRIVKHTYKNYPGLVRAMEKRHAKYNQTLEILRQMEQNGEVFIIQPKQPLKVSRIERNKQKLHDVYIQGYQQAEEISEALIKFVKSS